MSLLQLLAGTGRRRKSEENWNDLERKTSDAEARAAKVKGAVMNTCPARIHGDFWVHTNTPQPCPWCEITRLRGQLELVTMRPAPRPDAVAVAAPADQATAAIERPVDEPASDVTAETQPVDVRDLRAVLGEDDTVTLPAVTTVTPVPLDDTQMLVTWGRARDTEAAVVEAALNSPAPTPEYAATAVPPGLPDLAQGKVAAALATTNAD